MNSDDNSVKPKERPKRRLRYKGTHPRKFGEKYKELNPSVYSEDIEKIKARGATPAGTHRPICVKEILEILKPRPGEVVLDATLGYGGHASLILEKILPGGKLFGLDQDPIELPKTEYRLREKGYGESDLILGAINFSEAKGFLKSHGIEKVDVILADLGVSSMQIDNPIRGFSFKIPAPLDLRMNPKKGRPASNLLTRIKEEELIALLIENADEPHAPDIAKALIKFKPQSTLQLAEVIRNAIPRVVKKEGDAPVRRTFQALRIAVNDEFRALDQFLETIPQILLKRGRVAILSFHSGEDRRVKKSFQALERAGVYSRVAPEPVRASFMEQRENPRSKSAKLRWAVL